MTAYNNWRQEAWVADVRKKKTENISSIAPSPSRPDGIETAKGRHLPSEALNVQDAFKAYREIGQPQTVATNTNTQPHLPDHSTANYHLTKRSHGNLAGVSNFTEMLAVTDHNGGSRVTQAEDRPSGQG